MGSSTWLSDPAIPLVADTSVVINVICTGRAELVLDAVPNPIVVVDVILGELDTGRRRGRPHADRLQEIVASGHIEIVSLGDIGWTHFESLVAGPAEQTLDDGEAATIAYAVERGAVVILDEKKGTRICGGRFPNVQSITTIDLLLQPRVRRALGEQVFSDAVFAALKQARMAVFPHQLDEVISVIGPERALYCPSLPKAVRAAAGPMASPEIEHGP